MLLNNGISQFLRSDNNSNNVNSAQMVVGPAPLVNNVPQVLPSVSDNVSSANANMSSISSGINVVGTSTNVSNTGAISTSQNVIRNVGLPSVVNANLATSPLTSVCDPLGSNISPKIRQKIINNDLVQLVDNDQSQNKQDFTLSMNDQGQLTWEDARPKRRITSVHTWMSAFLVYSAIYLSAHPHRTREMLKYAYIICSAASRNKGWGWCEYDRLFRLKQQIQPLRSWATIDSELWTMYVASPGNMQWLKGTAINSFWKYSQSKFQTSNSRYAPFEKQTNQVCFAFDAAGCARDQCKIFHRCSKCEDNGHGASACKNTKQERGGFRGTNITSVQATQKVCVVNTHLLLRLIKFYHI